MKVCSLFAGIGGFDLAFIKRGHKIVYTNEWDKYATQIYEKNIKHKVDTRDIKKVKTDEIPDHDILVGGFPCQAFSVAGKGKGFDDTRGTLFFDIARILQDKRPRYFLLENVKGLLSHKSGQTFKTILGVFANLGYDCQWYVFNSKDFGVPQNRERIYIIGHIRGQRRPKILPKRANDQMAFGKKPGLQNTRQIATALRATDYKGTHNVIREITKNKVQTQRVYDPNGISPTLNTMQGGQRQPKIVLRQPLRYLNRNQKNFDGKYSFTIDASQTSGVRINNKIRRLTPVECERLQGFKDNYTEGVSDTQRYKMLGNAVTVNVVDFIVGQIF